MARSTAARVQKAVPADLKELHNLLLKALKEVHEGQLDPRRATAMASLAGALVRVHEIGELVVRIEQLEGRLEQ